MEEQEEKASLFRVVDRRRFTDKGETRAPRESSSPDIPADPERTEPRDVINHVSAESHVPPPSQDAQEDEKAPRESSGQNENLREERQKETQPPPLTFAVFMQSLGQQAMVAMGLLPWPDTGLIKVDLQRAQEMIDVIALLHDKTKGNLTHDEQQLCDALLYQLRMAFVQIRESGGPPGVGLSPEAPA